MKCFECDKTVQIKKYRAYMYKGTGLENICLLNQRVEVCSACNVETPILRNVGKLHRAIGVAIALQPTVLSGADMRFLRRSAGYKNGEMAGRLSVSDETYSRWENGKKVLTANADKLMRLTYLTALERNHPNQYTAHVATVVEMETPREGSYVIAITTDDLDKPAKYLPETHEIFEEPEASIVKGVFLTFEKTSLDIMTGVAASMAATLPVKYGETADVCNSLAPTA